MITAYIFFRVLVQDSGNNKKKNKVNYIENGIKSYLLKIFGKKKITKNKNSFFFFLHCSLLV